MRLLRKLNFPLVVGVALVGLLVIIGVVGPWVARRDPMETNFILEQPDGEFVTPPFAPGQLPGFPLGSDLEGRDILSRLLVGVRPTLILVGLIVAVRLAVGTLLGLVGGWYGGWIGDVISGITKAALSIPMLVLAILLIYLVGLTFDAWVFILALSITGWGAVARTVTRRVQVIRGEAYIEAARALGASDMRILFKHVLPQIRTLLLVTLSFEMSAVLLHMAELGFLGFFMGGGAIRLVPRARTPDFIQVRIAGAPELGQLMAGGWENFIYSPTLPVIVGTVFFLAIFSFMMLGEGLKEFTSETSTPGWMGLWREAWNGRRRGPVAAKIEAAAKAAGRV